MEDLPRIDRSRDVWRLPAMRKKLMDARGVYPTEVWGKTLDACECCDPDSEQPNELACRCEVKEFDFGKRWTFCLYDHKHVIGTTAKAVLAAFKEGQLQAVFTFDKPARAARGWLSPYCQAENKMLAVMGAPIDARFQEIGEPEPALSPAGAT